MASAKATELGWRWHRRFLTRRRIDADSDSHRQFQGVEAAHQLVVFEDGLAGAVLGRERAELVDQRGLAGFLERQGGNDAVEGIGLGRYQAAVDLSSRWQKERGVAADVAGAEEMRDLRLEAGEA